MEPERGDVVRSVDPFKLGVDAQRPWLVVNNESHPNHGEQYIAVAVSTRKYGQSLPLHSSVWETGGVPRKSFVRRQPLDHVPDHGLGFVPRPSFPDRRRVRPADVLDQAVGLQRVERPGDVGLGEAADDGPVLADEALVADRADLDLVDRRLVPLGGVRDRQQDDPAVGGGVAGRPVGQSPSVSPRRPGAARCRPRGTGGAPGRRV